MATLYRKYRPQRWQEVVNQNHIKITIEQEISAGRLAHAYLFCGPRAVGKTTVARVLAKSVNCQNRRPEEYEPCNKCIACRDITSGRSLDVMEIDAASHTGVDNVRENIIAAVRTAPSRDKYKIFIIDEAHMLSVPAFNALLKVLEEPPKNVLFILCTTEVHKIPTTIISRCQRFDFKRISVGDIVKKLQYIVDAEKIKIDKEILEAVARQSEGYMRDAESLLGQVVAIGGREITREEADLVIPRSDLLAAINLIGSLAKKDAGTAIGLINKLLDEGIDLKKFITDVIEVLRKMMITKINPALITRLGLELGENIELKINEIGRDMTLGRIVIFIERFVAARNDLKSSFIIQLPIEIAIAELCTTASAPRSAFSTAESVTSSPSGPSAVVNRPPAPVNQSLNNIRRLSKDLVASKWHEVLEKVKQHNHSLSFILRVCQPKDINGNRLCLAFRYKFHKDRMGEAAIKKAVENVLKDVYGQPITIEAVVDDNLEINGNGASVKGISKKDDNLANSGESKKKGVSGKVDAGDKMVKNLLDTFGGKVVK